MASTTSRARHRAATKPVTAFDTLKDTLSAVDGKKGLMVAATTGLALGTVWVGTAIASPEAQETAPQAAAPVATQVGDAVAQARLAVAANPEINVPENANWVEGQVEIPVQQQAEPEAPQAQSNTAENQGGRDTVRKSVARQAATVSQGTNTGAWAGQSGVAASIPTNIAGGSIADIALRYQGVPYVYGGTTPSGFDCSGFVGYVYRQAGISLPRTSWGQGASGSKVSAGEAGAGDIVYYGGHVGIYLGEGKMIHSPRPGERVEVVNVYGSPSYVRVGK
ncbi:C40 family peptidase [Mobiluncus mulieris]|uniref:Peptidoglycan endopeptidase n=1 Tax=Mobiluncus mulieris TaxID=2052 RepID=A0ABD4TY00_9ACTO|nr:C40 family peptidase [Mobiluncus mulieris]MCU9969092.1 peptidoglycan endopeptidase [Mobiluncus mulieris]MCU9973581.1 peptidoglycan endopeptidase [Mobiluncus mulieris]MCU9995036.1 peptidoglycan endopeptidase [Mobiluncus mulieris]MCV0009514.1 peptidoglycan endopeptidase [Mobiluncus mulieris]NMW75349.1 peptidoglycan endopeptidase [Mobiluncus mulieris]